MKPILLARFVLPILLTLAVLSFGGHDSKTHSSSLQNYADGELLVKFRPGFSQSRETISSFGARKIREFSAVGWQHVSLPQGMSVAEGIERYRALPGVQEVQPNFIYRVQATPNDPRFTDLYGLNKIQAPTVWDTTTGTPNVVVAVIDLGVDYNHEDLAANMWHNPGETGLDSLGHDKANNIADDDGNGYVDDVYGVDTINHDSDPMDDGGHGTHVAGTIGGVGNNATGVTGVNWTVRIMAIKTHDAAGNGTSASVVEAFQYAATMRQRGINVRVTNSSWGGAPEAPAYDQALKDAIDAAGNAGILNVCAAGNANNNNDANPFYPASYDSPSIIAVAASDQNDNRAGFSSYGLTAVDLAAPGVTILSTYRGSYAFLSGTSMATPHVAGAAALLSGYAPYLSRAELKAALMNSVDVLPQWSGLTVTGGRLNIARAFQSLPTTNQIDDADFFVRQHYADFLNRQPDTDGLAFWKDQITSCGSNAQCIEIRRINVSAAFFLSIEFQETGYLVERLYKSSYGDTAGTSTTNGTHQLQVPIIRFSEFLSDAQQIGQGLVVGQPGWEQVLENNKVAFIAGFVQRARFTNAYPISISAAQFVDTLNVNAGGVLSQSERNQLVGDLDSGAKTRAEVLRAVAENVNFVNNEKNRAFVLMQYFGYLRRNPNGPPDSDYSGYDFWLTKLNQFNGNFVNADMVKAFLISTEYRQRFGPP